MSSTTERVEIGDFRNVDISVLDENDERLDYYLSLAAASPRRRLSIPLHEPWEHENRMLNFLLPDSYIRPHKHTNPHSTDTIVALRGYFNVVTFAISGEIDQSEMLLGRKIISIHPNTWHTVVVHTPGVLVEFKGHGVGGYDPQGDKVFPDWAPQEGSPGEREYLEGLKAKIDEMAKSS